jgi:hypothetical protein
MKKNKTLDYFVQEFVEDAEARGFQEIEPENEKNRSFLKARGERTVVAKGAELPRGWRSKKAHFLN